MQAAGLAPLETSTASRVNLHGAVCDVNRRTCQLAGLARLEIIDAFFADYFTDPAAPRAGVEQAFRAEVLTD